MHTGELGGLLVVSWNEGLPIRGTGAKDVIMLSSIGISNSMGGVRNSCRGCFRTVVVGKEYQCWMIQARLMSRLCGYLALWRRWT